MSVIEAKIALLRHRRTLYTQKREALPMDHPLRERYDLQIEELKTELLSLGAVP